MGKSFVGLDRNWRGVVNRIAMRGDHSGSCPEIEETIGASAGLVRS
jgi:hypothetical protein